MLHVLSRDCQSIEIITSTSPHFFLFSNHRKRCIGTWNYKTTWCEANEWNERTHSHAISIVRFSFLLVRHTPICISHDQIMPKSPKPHEVMNSTHPVPYAHVGISQNGQDCCKREIPLIPRRKFMYGGPDGITENMPPDQMNRLSE